MKNPGLFTILCLAVFAFLYIISPIQAGLLGTAFTYQGRLIDANTAADGLYDMQFKLYDSPADGNQIGSTLDANEVDVIDGYFTVLLNFGGSAFNGDERWLSIGVRPGDMNDPNAYTVLTPRQEVKPTPYASYAKTAQSLAGGIDWSEILNVPAGFADGVDDGLTTETDPTVPASVKDGISWSEVSGRPAGLDDGDDIGLLAESDPQVGSNTTNYVPKWNGSALAAGTIFDNGNIGIGTASPSQKLHIVGSAYISSVVYEGGTSLVDKYLGKTATAANSDMVDNKHAADFVSTSLVGTSYVVENDSTADTLFTMTTAGWTIKDDGDTDNDHTLILSTTSQVMEYTLWYGGTVTQGEASTISSATITVPHYQGFHLILARPFRNYIASLVCKENDNHIVCTYHKSHP